MNGAVMLRLSKRSIGRFRSSGLWCSFGWVLPGGFEGTSFHRHVRNHSDSDRTSYSGRPEFSEL